ncbi:hypothetical protein NP233_g7078 [Leucocoprinus birnbaumii]|uniref:Uncharacterized protein n=1 Tax=Leucocoprinus birnbaumii TaxID=56174 RepID=A0AAD5VR09_9AGAR|nr:hypothetical protein NP233_g7078 [Leucocoprinus birnbaumii]
MHGHHARGHQNISRRAPAGMQLWKRFSNARWTFYAVGLGACGKTNVPSDFIVALNSAQFGGGYPGPQCFKTISMSYNGKTATAQIMDECPGCPYGGLDLSEGLFKHFAAESVGVIYGTWSFTSGGGGGGGDDGGDDTPKTTKKPSPTTHQAPTTTHKYTPPSTPDDTPTPTPSTSSTHSTTESSSTSASSSSGIDVSISVGSAAPSASANVDVNGNINLFNEILANMGGLVVGAARGD